MKYITYIFALVLSFTALAQDRLIYVEYEHGQFISTFSNKEILIAEENNAFYQVQELKSIENRVQQSQGSSKNLVVLPFKSINSTKLYKSQKTNYVFFDDYVDDKQYFIKDTLPEMNWELVPEQTKEIQGYLCKKAKLKYRGSEFTAYYTPDILINFGPWKFSGLPGLILEITLDDDVTFYWKASKIVHPYTEKVSFKFDKMKYETSLRTFIKEKEKDRDEKQRIFDEKYAKGAVIIRTYNPVGPEKVYEWQ